MWRMRLKKTEKIERGEREEASEKGGRESGKRNREYREV
jgi:hypothetical protein